MDKELNIILKPHEMDESEMVVIRKAGYYERVKNHQMHRQNSDCLDEAIFIYCLEGSGWLKTAQGTTPVEKGMAIFCDRNVPHAYGTNPQNPWTLLWVHFNGTFSYAFAKVLKSEDTCSVITIGYNDKIIQHMHQMIQLLNESDEFLQRLTAYTYLKISLCEVMLQVQQKASHKPSIDAYIRQSIEIMQHSVNTTLTLDEICHEINLSKYYFSRQFKISTGLSPMSYFNRLKIQKATTLLISNTYRIQEISAMMGFSTPYYFSELFKQFTGFSPREYKNLHERKY